MSSLHETTIGMDNLPQRQQWRLQNSCQEVNFLCNTYEWISQYLSTITLYSRIKHFHWILREYFNVTRREEKEKFSWIYSFKIERERESERGKSCSPRRYYDAKGVYASYSFIRSLIHSSTCIHSFILHLFFV